MGFLFYEFLNFHTDTISSVSECTICCACEGFFSGRSCCSFFFSVYKDFYLVARIIRKNDRGKIDDSGRVQRKDDELACPFVSKRVRFV